MNKELYVSSTPHETRVALTEDDQLAEIFFERENEYTLAGSIYKGRVTRVLPGMQSAFVDIGLERDAFLYVSDFLEVGEEGEEEFGDIPAPRTTIDFPNQQQSAAPPEIQASVSEGGQEEAEGEAEEFGMAGNAHGSEDSEGEAEESEPSAAAGEQDESEEGARRWRGRRRRRGGRRGRGDERDERPARTEAAGEQRSEERPEAPRSDSGSPPRGYTPIVLPGESISKYRGLNQRSAGPGTEAAQPEAQSAPTETHTREHEAEAQLETAPEVQILESPGDDHHEEQHHAEPAAAPRGHLATEPEQLEWAAGGAHRPSHGGEESSTHVSVPEVSSEATDEHRTGKEPEHTDTSHEQDDLDPLIHVRSTDGISHWNSGRELDKHSEELHASMERWHRAQAATGESARPDAGDEPPVDFEADQTIAHLQPNGDEVREHPLTFPAHEAPLTAPAGRTLEHETLEDDEMEFHPMPENLEALSEAAADSDLDLIEETLDAENDYNERWVPKIADVDEEEVLAAEMRGETYNAEADEEENGDDYEEEETNGRAEVRAPAATAGYQRQTERPAYDRRGQRGRRSRRNNVRMRPHSYRAQPLITDLLKEGQEVLVQIAKEPIGKKGARITSHIALPGRFLVYMPTVNHVGVSRKINSEEERQRLKRIVTSERENGLGGFIVRTAAANIKEEDLRADIRFLKHLWAEIKKRAESSKAPAVIYHDLNLVERILRDQVNAEFSQIWVDTQEEYERVVRFSNRFQPSLVRRIKLYTKETPLFEQFGIQAEIDRSLKSKVWLKSGGYIVINQTEALVAIDINTGKYVGKTQRLEDTIVKTNVDAIREIVRQIRLRDLGGIIVIDFIDMDERKNRQKVMQALEEALRSDRAPSKALQFNDFGLVAITRKRVKQSLERTLGEPCPYCTGAGFVKSVTTVCNEVYVEMRKMIKEHDRKDVTLRVNPEVAKALKANNGKLIGEMEELIGKTVIVKSDPLLHQENFDIH
jgi:ribonuclease G